MAVSRRWSWRRWRPLWLRHLRDGSVVAPQRQQSKRNASPGDKVSGLGERFEITPERPELFLERTVRFALLSYTKARLPAGLCMSWAPKAGFEPASFGWTVRCSAS